MMQTLFSNEALKNVDYLGSVPYEKIKEYICDATICVFPTFAEALPVSWIEAMALGKAIVASNIGWAIEIIDNEENGFLVHPKNHVEFAEKILNLMSNFELRNSLGQNAKQKVVENFSLQVIAKKNQDFYRKVLDQKHD
jgi:glycosyltransferase involved in cell wall biosynthesis